ncbi:MAG: hypothetical protein KBD53_00930 [Candidatus Omnitrophica bacterium]|nr:hypothetical protein [Candidatus Omnitrophota bacterium]
MLGAVIYFYLNRILLPGHIKTAIETEISKSIHRPVFIQKVSFKLIKGFSLENILIMENDKQRAFLTIDEVYFNILLIPFIKNKIFIIPSVTLQKPIIQIIQNTDNSFNFSDMLVQEKNKPVDNRNKIFIAQLKVIEGKADFLKKNLDHDFSERFKSIDVHVTVGLKRDLSYQLSAFVPGKNSFIHVKGNYAPGTYPLQAKISLVNIDFNHYLKEFYASPLPLLNPGKISGANINVYHSNQHWGMFGDIDFSGTNIQFSPEVKISGDAQFKNASIVLDQQTITASGELQIPEAKYNFGQENSFEGNIRAVVPSFSYNLTDHNFNLDIGLKADQTKIRRGNDFQFTGNLTSHNTTLVYRNPKLSIFGDFDIADTNLYFSEDKQYAGHMLLKNFSLELVDGHFIVKSFIESENSKITLGKTKLLNSHISTDDFYIEHSQNTLNIQSQLRLQDAVMTFPHGYQFQGSPTLDFKYMRNILDANESELSGRLRLNSGLITGLPYIDTASNINGDLVISNNKISIESTKFNAENTNFKVSGEITDFKNMIFNMVLSTESIDLKRIMKYFPDFFTKYKIDLSGRSAIKLSYRGNSDDSDKQEIKVDARLQDAVLTSEKLPAPIEHLDGFIHYSKDSLKWSDLRGEYKNFPFKLTGELRNFSKPVINTSLRSKNLTAKAKIRLYMNAIRFPILEAKYLQSHFSGSADIYFSEPFGSDIQFTGQTFIQMSDLADVLPAYKETIERLGIEGTVDTDIIFRGNPNDWKNWNLSLDGKSSSLTIKNHPLTDVKFTYLQRDKNISKFNVFADLYQGELNAISSLNLEHEEYPFKLGLDLFDANLADLASRQKLKNKLSGKANLNLTSEGYLLDYLTWRGKGKFDVKDGYLWQLNIIQGLSNILLIKEFTHTVYTGNHADFTVHDGKIFSDNLYLESQTMKLNVKGWMDFSQNINFDVYPTLSEIAMIKSDSIKKITSSILARNITSLKVTGTLQKPAIEPKTSPLRILKNTGGAIKEGVGGIVEGIIKR